MNVLGLTGINSESSIDQSAQPALIWPVLNSQTPRPLLVSLHTWSFDLTQQHPERIDWCQLNRWHFIQPNFRGPNNTPDALGSDKAVADIADAVAYMRRHFAVDDSRIYLLGCSGGGHAALLQAGRHPELWAGVSAWVPISDVRAWWETHKGKGYGQQIEACCGGDPATNSAANAECRKRSPLTYLASAKPVNLDINGGFHDGRRGSVPFSHSLWAFNTVADEKDRIPRDLIQEFYDKHAVPAALQAPCADPLYGGGAPVFRRTSRNVRVTIFDGGHECIERAALAWLSAQRKGQPAVWNIDAPAGENRSVAVEQ